MVKASSKMMAALLEAEWRPRPGYRTNEVEEKTHRTYFGGRVWYRPKVKVVSDYPVPSPGPKDVLVKVKACGICGSDLHMIETDGEGYMLYPGLTRLPVVIGHEFSGQVVEVGCEVTSLKAGDMVTAEEMWWCGECDACRTDNLNQCMQLEEMGFTKDGAHAEYIVVNHKYCWKINSLLNVYRTEDDVYEAGALTEPTCVAYNAMFVRAGGFKPGAYVVVWGGGPIGLAATALAKAAGASKIIVFEVSRERGELAKNVGADYVFNPIELEKDNVKAYEKVLDVTGGYGADMLVEAAGAPERTLPQMEKCLAIGAKIAWIGRADREAPIYVELLQTHAAQLYGAQGHSGYGTFLNVIRLMASGKIDMRKIVTGRYPLSRFNEAIERLSKRVDAKILIKP